MVAMFAAVLVPVLAPFLPSPHDVDGLGLRLLNFSTRGPYLVGEDIGQVRFEVTLINYSRTAITYDPFQVAQQTKSLQISVSDPDGQPLPTFGCRFTWPRDAFTESQELRPGEAAFLDFQFKEFGYWVLPKAGRYRVEGTWVIDGRKHR